jgi:hypothetical protein
LKVYQYALSGTGTLPAPAPVVRASQPALPIDDVPVATDTGRTCLRCSAAMLPSKLQRGILAAQFDAANDSSPMARAWICTRCGQVELVVEQTVAPLESGASAPAERPAVVSDDAEPVEQTAQDEGPALVSADGTEPVAEQAVSDEAPALVSDDGIQPVAEQATPDETPADMLAAGQPPSADEPPEQVPANVSDELPAGESPVAAQAEDTDTAGEAQPRAALAGPSHLPTEAEPDQLELEVAHHTGHNGKSSQPSVLQPTSSARQPAAPAATAQKQRQPRTKRRKSS